jgi:hypothetical protein
MAPVQDRVAGQEMFPRAESLAMSPMQDIIPVHSIVHWLPPQRVLAAQLFTPEQVTTPVAATLSTPNPQDWAPAQPTVHVVPPHRICPRHDPCPRHEMAQADADRQSICPAHPDGPHGIWHGIPGGHVIFDEHAPCAAQSKTHAPAAPHCPPMSWQFIHARVGPSMVESMVESMVASTPASANMAPPVPLPPEAAPPVPKRPPEPNPPVA